MDFHIEDSVSLDNEHRVRFIQKPLQLQMHTSQYGDQDLGVVAKCLTIYFDLRFFLVALLGCLGPAPPPLPAVGPPWIGFLRLACGLPFP